MLVLRLEIWPFGDARRVQAIEQLTITNVGWIDDERCLYEVRLGDRMCRVRHRRADGAVVLGKLALTAILRRRSNGDPPADPGAAK